LTESTESDGIGSKDLTESTESDKNWGRIYLTKKGEEQRKKERKKERRRRRRGARTKQDTERKYKFT
jgi:hypothetical protein